MQAWASGRSCPRRVWNPDGACTQTSPAKAHVSQWAPLVHNQNYLAFSHWRPLSVKRYLCKRLLGLSGIVISIRPSARAGLRYRLRKDLRSESPSADCSASRTISPVNEEVYFCYSRGRMAHMKDWTSIMSRGGMSMAINSFLRYWAMSRREE